VRACVGQRRSGQRVTISDLALTYWCVDACFPYGEENGPNDIVQGFALESSTTAQEKYKNFKLNPLFDIPDGLARPENAYPRLEMAV
jgi:hypothetical protein